MADKLNARGVFLGSTGAPGSTVQLGTIQNQRAIQTKAVTGQAIGAAAVMLVRGAFQRNVIAAGGAIAKACGFGGDCANASGYRPAPKATGWDGHPLDGS